MLLKSFAVSATPRLLLLSKYLCNFVNLQAYQWLDWINIFRPKKSCNVVCEIIGQWIHFLRMHMHNENQSWFTSHSMPYLFYVVFIFDYEWAKWTKFLLSVLYRSPRRHSNSYKIFYKNRKYWNTFLWPF